MAKSTGVRIIACDGKLVNHTISSISQESPDMKEELEKILSSAATNFRCASYKTAAKYYKSALDLIAKHKEIAYRWSEFLIKYMLCSCWLEHEDAEDLWGALKMLEELERDNDWTHPMVYYSMGKGYFKLYRFSKAKEMLKKSFAACKDENSRFVTFVIPETDFTFPESSRVGLTKSVVELLAQCANWRQPDTVCCLPDCLTIGHTESEDKNIFYGSPTFVGIVRVTCDSPSNFCVMNFHLACWKAKKEILCSTRKMSDKEILHWVCFTPNCVNDDGERSTIKKIEIFDRDVRAKATIEPRGDDLARHAKAVSTSKGAIKKQQYQQQPKLKAVSSETRSPIVRNPRPAPVAPKEATKVDVTEEEEDFHDEQALKLGIERLRQLRLRNFGVKNDEIWRPNLSMYGSEYMLATTEVLPDPDFSNDSPENSETKTFIFSYFYALISENGPMKLETLVEKWKEAQEKIFEKNCESILRHHTDITEFLVQSLKFSIIGDYICTADKLPEAYDLAKADACEILKFFMDNDGDRHSVGSSLDDEALFNDIVNEEKNNNTLPYSTISENDKTINKESSVLEASMTTMEKHENETTNDFDEAKSIAIEEEEKLPEIEAKSSVRRLESLQIAEAAPICNIVKENKQQQQQLVASQPSLEIDKFSFPGTKIVQKRAHSPEISGNAAAASSSVNNGFKMQKECRIDEIDRFHEGNSPKNKLNGTYSVNDIEKQLRCTQSSSENMNLTRMMKSTDDLANNINGDTRKMSVINHPGEPYKRSAKKNETAPPLTMINNEKTIKSEAKSNGNVSLEVKNTESHLVTELIAEVQKLNDELSRRDGEMERLKFELAQVKNANTSSKGEMLKKILHGQYDYNGRIIHLKWEEWRYHYNIISGIQQMLAASTGQTLPINGTEMMKCINEIEQIAKNHKEKFVKLNEELCANLEMGNLRMVDLPREEIPIFPKFDLLEIVQSAFGMYRMHQLKEFQKLQIMPCPLPQIQRPPPSPALFGAPHNAGNFYSPSQAAFMHSMTQQIVQMQHLPLLAPLIPPQVHYKQQQQQQQPQQQQFSKHPNQPNHYYPSPDTRQNSSSSISYQAENSSVSGQTNFHYPVDKNVQPIAKTTINDSQTSNHEDSTKSKIDEAPQESNDIAVPPVRNELFNAIENCVNSVDTKSREDTSTRSVIDTRITEVSLNNENRAANSAIMEKNSETIDNNRENCAPSLPKKNKTLKSVGHSMDKLMRRLKSHYIGVLELDLLKSVECVRKKHNNSLSKLPMLRIIREAEKFIEASQQKQLRSYEKHQPNQSSFSVLNLNSWCLADDERKHKNSVSSTSSVASSRKEAPSSSGSKKQWEPVSIPNENWINQNQESDCIICFEPMSNVDSITLQCKHSFHKKCIKNWYKHQTTEEWVIGSCPMCRVHSTIDSEYPPLPLG